MGLLTCLLLSPPESIAWEFPPSQAQNVDLCGHIGGACGAVAVKGNRVLIGQGPRLTSVDVSSPTRPVEEAGLLLPAMVRKIAWAGNLACVLADGLRVIDTGETGSLREVSHLPLSGEHLITTGTLLYVVGVSPNLQVVDLRHPANPLRVNFLDLPHGNDEWMEATSFLVKDRHAFVSYVRHFLSGAMPTLGGFMVFDISDPKMPDVVADFSLNFPVYGAAVEGNLLYLLLDRRVLLYDVTRPLAPREVGGVTGPSFAHDLSIAGSRAYIAGNQSAVWVFALAATDLPRELLRGTTRGEAIGIAATNDGLFVADGWMGLRIFDSTTTQSLVEIGGLDSLSEAGDVVVAGNHAYVAGGRQGLRVLDISNRDQPSEIAHFPTGGQASGISLGDSYAYVTEEESGLEILDIRRPATPVHLATFATTGSVHDIAFLGNYALIADGPGGLLLLDMTDPIHPVLFGRSNAPGYAEAVVGSINRAFVCDRSGLAGLWVFDVSSPGFPTVAERLVSAGVAVDVAADGPWLCVAEADQGLRVVDAGLVGFTRTTARVATSGSFQGVAYAGNLAYVADASFGLRVVNLLDPYNPSEAGFLATAGFPRRIALAYGRIYLAAGAAGLYVLRFRWSPDLTICDFHCDTQDVVAGSDLPLSGKVLNNSTTPTATAFSVKVYVSPCRDFTEPRLLLCPPLRIESGLDHLHPVDLSQQKFLVLSTVPRGVYRLGIIVDADNEVAEFREDNNLTWLDRAFYVGPRPTSAKSWHLYP